MNSVILFIEHQTQQLLFFQKKNLDLMLEDIQVITRDFHLPDYDNKIRDVKGDQGDLSVSLFATVYVSKSTGN